ncbi:MAG: hypothetical protein FJ104_13560 [Deltaproteobacteria bacterium]|nr:hypothetical protein [Deltaproteobacteria bacterium]
MAETTPTDGDPPTRDAATVVILREGAAGPEVFCVERHSRSRFLAGAIVFPGGKVDECDHHAAWSELATPLGARSLSLGQGDSLARALAVAALRESLEEAALLATAGRDLVGSEVEGLRAELRGADARGPGPLHDALRARGLRLDTARLEGFARWITPTFEPRRFDTRFYLLIAPEAQEGRHDDEETTRGFWARPADVLERWARGELQLAPPTSYTLERFAPATSVEEARRIARRESLAPLLPALLDDGGTSMLTLPGDRLHPTPPLPDRAPSLPTRFVLEAGRFVARHAPLP